MTKEQLRKQLESAYQQHIDDGNEVLLYAMSATQRDNVKRQLETRKKPENMKQAEWEQYLEAVRNGTYTPPEKPLEHPVRKQKEAYKPKRSPFEDYRGYK